MLFLWQYYLLICSFFLILTPTNSKLKEHHVLHCQYILVSFFWWWVIKEQTLHFGGQCQKANATIALQGISCGGEWIVVNICWKTFTPTKVTRKIALFYVRNRWWWHHFHKWWNHKKCVLGATTFKNIYVQIGISLSGGNPKFTRWP